MFMPHFLKKYGFIHMKHSLDSLHFTPPYIPLTHPENLFGNYYEKGDLIAREDMESVEDPEDPITSSTRYVLADITSFFTLLVGIYFPSVTGENLYLFIFILCDN